MADNLPPSSADVTESGSLNLPESSEPRRPVMGLLKKKKVPVNFGQGQYIGFKVYHINIFKNRSIKLLL
jgi:hypothetical protein